MSILRLLLPAVLVLFFFHKSTRARVFLLGIPFLMYMYDAIFLENVRIFAVPGRLEPADHMMLWLVLTWVVCTDLLLPPRLRRIEPDGGRLPRPFGGGFVLPEEGILAGVAGIVVLNVLVEAFGTGRLLTAVGEAKGPIYLLAGFLLVRGIVCRATREQVISFLTAIVAVNTIAAVLFVAHQGLGLPVYAGKTEYAVFSFMGQTLTRSFYFMPQFLGLAVAWAISRRRWDVWSVAVILITFAALWVSYTRSLLVIGMAEIVLVLALRLAKGRQFNLVARRVVSLLAIVVILGALVYVFLPAQTQFFLSRIDVAVASPNVADEPNLVNRQNKMRRVWGWTQEDGRVLGVGFTDPETDPRVKQMQDMASDIVWVPVLFQLGGLGVVLFSLLYLTALWRCGRGMLRGRGDGEYLWLILCCLLLASALEGFVSWTFMNPFKYPLGLWPFAFVSALTLIEQRAPEDVELSKSMSGGGPDVRSKSEDSGGDPLTNGAPA